MQYYLNHAMVNTTILNMVQVILFSKTNTADEAGRKCYNKVKDMQSDLTSTTYIIYILLKMSDTAMTSIPATAEYETTVSFGSNRLRLEQWEEWRQG